MYVDRVILSTSYLIYLYVYLIKIVKKDCVKITMNRLKLHIVERKDGLFKLSLPTIFWFSRKVKVAAENTNCYSKIYENNV